MNAVLSRRSLALSVIACLCLLGQARAEDAPPEQVRIKFDWPAGLTAQVSGSKLKSRSKDGGEATRQEVRMRYLMQTARKGENLLVSFSEPELDPTLLRGLPEEQRRFLAVLTQAALPSYLVSGRGDFIGLENFEGMVAAMKRLLNETFADVTKRRRAQPMLDQILSAPVLTAFAKSEWDWMVGAWSGAEQAFEMGAEYLFKGQVPVPLFGNALVDTETRFEFKRKLPCTRSGVTRECVELHALNHPDADKLAALIEQYLAKLAPEAAAKSSIGSMESAITLELVAETDTLLPHSFSLRKDISVTGLGNGNQSTSRSTETTKLEFSYPAGK